jgi:hypothetical protein
LAPGNPLGFASHDDFPGVKLLGASNGGCAFAEKPLRPHPAKPVAAAGVERVLRYDAAAAGGA